MNKTENRPYAPFILIEDPDFNSLLLTDEDMVSKVTIFESCEEQSWEGNGYDWASVAQVIVKERLPNLAGAFNYDPEAGMLSIQGPILALKKLAAELKQVYEDDDQLRDILSRAKQ